jgi:ABC-type sugar transport system ATPase subunit
MNKIIPPPSQEQTGVSAPVLVLRGIHKAFGGVVAIQSFNLDVMPGEIVALVGDNGAGKSTLVKIIAGVYPATSGQFFVDSEQVHFTNPSQSQSRGIQVVYQDLALADSQPVYMNMFLGREKVKGPLRRLERNDQ